MKINWKHTMVVCVLTASLIIPSASFHVAADEKYTQTSVESYSLTDSIQVEVKSILNESTPDGTRIAATVRIYNNGDRLTGVPEYEVRVKGQDGLEYIMRASQANAKNIQPKETVELSYMNVVDRYDTFSLTDLSWYDVNEFVYPKQEQKILTIPISAIEWKGEKATLANPAVTKKWEDTFTIPVLSNTVDFKPVSLNEQNTPEGPMVIVGLLVTNKGDKKAKIPDFRINGISDKKVYTGKRLEKDLPFLEANEQVYIHYAIPARNRLELSSLSILTPEDFADEKAKTDFLIGRLMITLPGAKNNLSFVNQLIPYEWNKPIRFDPLNKLIRPEIDVSMVDLQLQESAGGGFKAAVAKFKLLNHSDSPMQVPPFQAALTSYSGNKYMGTRQNTQVETLIPNISYVIYYSFIIPSSETGEQLIMEILDNKSVEPYNISLAAFKTKVMEETSDKSLAFYPFQVTMNDWSLGANYNMGGSLPYAYKLNVDFNIKLQDEVVVDQSFSKMRLELVDTKNRIMTSKVLSFTGENKLVSGTQTLNFDLDRLETTVSLHMYEIIDTPFGEVRRLVQTWKR